MRDLSLGEGYTPVRQSGDTAEESASADAASEIPEETLVSRRIHHLLIIAVAAVGLLGCAALLRGRAGHPQRAAGDTTFLRPAAIISEWSLTQRLEAENVPTLPPHTPGVGVNVTCDADIIVQSDFGSMRVRSSAYKGGQVAPVLDNILPWGCTVSYSVACDGGWASLHTRNSCKPKNVTRSFFKHLIVVGIQKGYEKDVKAGSLGVISFPSDLLPNVTSGMVKLQATFDRCDTVSPGLCRAGCCEPGLQCISNHTALFAHPGVCLAPKFSAEEVCKTPVTAACSQLVANFTELTTYWELVITSKGGSGHLAAAKNIMTLREAGWKEVLAASVQRFDDSFSQLTPFGQIALTQTLKRIKVAKAPIEVMDIMSSPCTNLFGSLGGSVGGFMERTWNSLQASGDIFKLKLLLKGQVNVDTALGQQCLVYMRSVLQGSEMPRYGSPRHIIATEPMLLSSITQAVQEGMDNGHELAAVDVYMTDLPGKGKYSGLNFFGPIKHMAEFYPRSSRRVRLHTVAPLTGGAAAIGEDCGLDASQIVIEPFMPVTPQFLPPYTDAMPRPGSAAMITLKASIPEERSFLGGSSKAFPIAAADQVLLVMLGSQPTVGAMHTYLDQASKLRQPPVGAMRWVFFACGSHGNPMYRDLYIAMAEKAKILNEAQAKAGLRLRFVPFTAQPAQVIESRAEVTVTRSGGMTAGELLALHSRGDRKQVILHIENLAGVPAKPPPGDAARLAAWEGQALDMGMVTWEAGNAYYLIRKAGAELTFPETLASTVKFPQDASGDAIHVAGDGVELQ